MAVPLPVSAKRENYMPFGLALSDYKKLKRELNNEELKKIEEPQPASGVVVQPLEVRTMDGLLEKKIRVSMRHTVFDEKGVLAWFIGRSEERRGHQGRSRGRSRLGRRVGKRRR